LLPTVVAVALATSAAPAAAGGGAPKVAFVTSVEGSGDFSSWDDALVGDVGLVAADRVCQARADAVGLGVGGRTFVAWASATGADAYCRVQGLPGTKANNCGGPEPLPHDAGPWVRVDGKPFAARVDLMSFPLHVVYRPLWLSELGVLTKSLVWTATTDESAGIATNCGGWTSSVLEDLGWAGDSTSTARTWTGAYGNLTCAGTNLRLYCFETGPGPALPPETATGRLAFVTSTFGPASLGTWPEVAGTGLAGPAAGDGICRARASAAGLPRSQYFKAWLSAFGVDAKARFLDGGRFVRPDGVVVANGINDLTDGELLTSIGVDELGSYHGHTTVWTGSYPDGTAVSGAHCDSWQSISPGVNVAVGNPAGAGTSWSHWFDTSCDQGGYLYCLADDPLIFADGVEAGTTAGWSASVAN
jgi:hypothetical protein